MDIICDILHLARRPVQRTKIMYNANLSYAQLMRYLNLLMSRNLLSTQHRMIVSTERGKEFLALAGHHEEAHADPSRM